ncbi:MAG: V-type ATP synthase subunit I [Candidatus Ratteibacteria bacterium]|nr:V-type ATP synthase subunit I [Candidatus Ratteibacteria bacterium]
MSVVKMQKVRIIGLIEDKEDLISQLQESQLIHIKDFKEGALDDYFGDISSDDEERHISEEITHIESAISFMERFDENKPLIENFFPPRIEIEEKEFKEIVHNFNYKKIIKYVNDIREKILKIDEKITSLHGDISILTPFKNLSWFPCEAKETKNTKSFFLKGQKEKYILLNDKFSEIDTTHLEVISEDSDFIYLLLVYCKENDERIRSILKEQGFESINLPLCDKLPSKAIDYYEKQMASLLEEKEKLFEKSRQILKNKDKLMIIHDWFLFGLQREEAKEHLRESERTFVLQGWVREDRIHAMKEILKEKFPATYLENIVPDDDEIPPIAVKNPPVIRPFQSVTNLFGLPHYGEVDPSGLVAPFFFVFFGLCIADVGYGITLIALSFWAMRKIIVGKEAKQFFYLFMLGGFSAILWGIVTGGWFGIDAAKLPPFLKNAILFNPLEDLMTFFVLSLCFGVIQILFGIGVEMYEQLREKNFAIAFADQLSYIIIIPGIILWVLSKQNPSLRHLNQLGFLIIASGVTIMLVSSLFKGKNPIWELIIGILAFFWKAKDFLGNVLSYSRLMALGLAGSVIAFVVNTFAVMALKIPYLGILVALLFIVIGHIANIVINTLGAFIHTMRLQFVEFFPYFFQGGGEAFQPLCRESKYIISKN